MIQVVFITNFCERLGKGLNHLSVALLDPGVGHVLGIRHVIGNRHVFCMTLDLALLHARLESCLFAVEFPVFLSKLFQLLLVLHDCLLALLQVDFV